MREVVTLQLGHFANYNATHFWNTQESYFTYSDDEASFVNHDIHWRAGIGASGEETFLPRTVIYDLKGGFGTLRKTNSLYDDHVGGDAAASSLWPGTPAVYQQKSLMPSDYQKSLNAGSKPLIPTSSSVEYWSDFSRVYYHPKSLVQLYDYELQSNIMPFERFVSGTDLFHLLDKDDGLMDNDWRPFTEECDHMQGIQVYTSLDDAWGGFAASYVEALRDEHPKTSIWVWGFQAPLSGVKREARQLKLVNLAHGLHELADHASMVLPMSAPEQSLPHGINLDTTSPWQLSGLFATALESALLPTRLHQEHNPQLLSMTDLTQHLNLAGDQNLASVRMAVGSEKIDVDNELSHMMLSAIGSPKPPIRGGTGVRVFGRVSCLRGAKPTHEIAAKVEVPQRLRIGHSVFRSYAVPVKFSLLDSFPSLYSSASDAVVVHTTLTTDNSVRRQLKDLGSEIGWSLGPEGRESLLNGLSNMGDAYQDDWSSGSDLDDDEV